MQNMLRQAQKLQQDAIAKQEELESAEYEAVSGGGVVKAKINGRHELLSLEIDREVVDPEDTEMLADLVMAAVNEAVRKAVAQSEEEMSKITGGLNIPGMPGMF